MNNPQNKLSSINKEISLFKKFFQQYPQAVKEKQ